MHSAFRLLATGFVRTLLPVLVLLVTSSVAAAQSQKVVANDATVAASFGHATAVVGGTAVIGSYTDNVGTGFYRGSAYVFVRVGGAWTQKQKLTGAPVDLASFGTSVAFDGSTIVVGAPGESSSHGAVYVFVQSGGVWSLQQKLTVTETAQSISLGHGVAVSGDTLAASGPDVGKVYVWTRTGSTWTPQQTLTAANPPVGYGFGASLAMSGDTIVAGAPWADAAQTGAGYVFARSGGVWSQQARLASGSTAERDWYANSVAIDGDTIAIGAPQEEAGGFVDSGATYVYTRSGAEWSLQRKITPADAKTADHFGYSVSLAGDTLAAGSPYRWLAPSELAGAAYVFERTGERWAQRRAFVNPERPDGELFAFSVAASGGTLLAAKPPAADYRGAAWFYSDVLAPGSDTLGVYGATDGVFFLRNANSPGPANSAFTFGPAGSALVPITGDWNGDGADSPGLYDSISGTFFLRNGTAPGPADAAFTFGPGSSGLIPLAGDWNGDGVDTIGIYDPTTGAFFLRNTAGAGGADVAFVYGPAGAGLLPLAGDFDGDGIDTVGLYDRATGALFLKNANGPGGADLVFTFGPAGTNWVPLAGDFDGDGADSIGLYAPANGTFFLKNSNASGGADVVAGYGPVGLIPLVGDWNGQ